MRRRVVSRGHGAEGSGPELPWNREDVWTCSQRLRSRVSSERDQRAAIARGDFVCSEIFDSCEFNIGGSSSFPRSVAKEKTSAPTDRECRLRRSGASYSRARWILQRRHGSAGLFRLDL